MSVAPPDEPLRTALLRLGDQGDRAQRFLGSAAKHLDDAATDPMASHHAAYALREALMSIVELGGARPRGMSDAASEVVRRFEAAGADANRLTDSIRKLAEVLSGPGTNAIRVERALSELAGLPPTRASADLISRFIDALGTANDWTHASTPRPVPDVVALYEETTAVLRGLFGPMSERLADMDELVGNPEPGPAEVERLRQRLGDERHLVYLFDRAEGPGWFRALHDDSLLLPPTDKLWVAGAYVTRIAQSNPDEVRTWLEQRQISGVNAKQAAELLRIARLAGGDVGGIALGLARDHLDDPNVRVQADALLRELTPQLRDSRAARSLTQRLLTSTLAERGGSHDAYIAAEQLSLAIAAAQGSNAVDWLKMIAHRVRETASAERPIRLRVLPPLSELTLTGARRPLELAAAALLRAAVAAAEAGVPLNDRLDLLRIAPEPLADRVVAQHLLDRLPDTDAEARSFIRRQVATNVWPSPEELSLLRRLLDDAGSNAPAVARDIADALGAPPTAEAIAELASADEVHDDLVRAHRWLVAIPSDSAPEWLAADEQLGTYLGPASPDGVMMRTPQARFFGTTSPIDSARLAELSPLQAAERVAAWRPEQPVSFLGPSAEGLAGTLAEVIGADLDAWLTANPVQIAETLRQPLYISVFIDALRNSAERATDPERLVALTELVRSEPWPPDDLGPDPLGPQNTWLRPGDAAIQLLGRIGELDALRGDVADRAWAQVGDAFNNRGDTNPNVEDHTRDPLGEAINRPSMRALDQAFAIGARGEAPDPRLLDLLDGVLGVHGVDGLHARAILVRRLPWLRHTAPEWFAERSSKIFGSDAPDSLGPATVDLYLEWSDPTRDLLIEQRSDIVEALGRKRHEEAAQHILHGLLWSVPGFEPAEVAGILIATDDREVSYAARWLGWGLADDDLELEIAPIIDLWRELLSHDLPAAAYAGFGWMAINPHIGDDDWLALTESTTRATAGALDEADRVAERASRAPADLRAARIIAALLAAGPKPWDLQRIGMLGLQVLPEATGDAATELRERLLERGFYEALDL